MKKIFSLLLVFVMLFSLSISTFAATNKKDDTIKVKLCNYIDKNGKWVDSKYIEFDVEPQIIDGRTMVPIRAIAEELGYNVSWVGFSNLVGISKVVKEDDVNDYLDKYTQFKDFVYLIRQLESNNNNTAFDMVNKKHYSEVISDPNAGVLYSNNIYTVDNMLYNRERFSLETGFFVNKNVAFTELVGYQGDIRDILEYTFELDVPPQVIENRTLVPLRAAGELLGLQVEWDNKNRTVIMTA